MTSHRENTRDHGARDARGRWLPGRCPNPAGRPRSERAFLERCRDAAGDALEVVLGVLRDPQVSGKLRLEAARLVLERAYGRPPSAALVRLEGSTVPAEGLDAAAALAILHEEIAALEKAQAEEVEVARLIAARDASSGPNGRR